MCNHPDDGPETTWWQAALWIIGAFAVLVVAGATGALLTWALFQ